MAGHVPTSNPEDDLRRRAWRGVRRAFQIAGGVFCAVAIFMWVRGSDHFDRLTIASSASPQGRSHLLFFISWSRRCMIELDSQRFDGPNAPSAQPHWRLQWASGQDDAPENWNYGLAFSPSSVEALGCKYYQSTQSILGAGEVVEYRRSRGIAAPWLLLAAASACCGPVWVLGSRIRRSRRMTANLCIHCGYDLRGSTDRCPECGMAIAQKIVQ